MGLGEQVKINLPLGCNPVNSVLVKRISFRTASHTHLMGA